MPCAKAHREQDLVAYRQSIRTTRPRLPWLRRAHPSRRSHLSSPDGEPAAIRTQKLLSGIGEASRLVLLTGGGHAGRKQEE
jgi:hypothetical protein